MKRLLAWSVAFASVCGAAGLAWTIHSVLPEDGRPAHGVFVGAKIPPRTSTLGAWLEQRRQIQASKRMLLLRGLGAYEMTLADLGVEIDVAKTMDRALLPGREGTWQQHIADSATRKGWLHRCPRRVHRRLAARCGRA